MVTRFVCSVLVLALTFAGIAQAARLPGDLNTVITNDDPRLQHFEGFIRQQHRRDICEEPSYRKSVLKLVQEIPFAGLFNNSEHTKFEASAVTIAQGKFWAIFDNLRAIGVFDLRFRFDDAHSTLISDGDAKEESQFEGLTYAASSDTFYALRESAERPTGRLTPSVEELRIAPDRSNFTSVRECHVNFTLSHQNKGFEGLHYHEDAHGYKYLLGLCEGNYCTGGKDGRERGNGRVVVAREGKDDDKGSCHWDVVKVVHIPSSANFQDYSDFAFRGSKVGIISQEDSALWVGEFDFDKFEFVGDGDVFNTPRDSSCTLVYCNIEGIQWIDDTRVVIASDKAKSVQPYACTLKDQSVHTFALPR